MHDVMCTPITDAMQDKYRRVTDGSLSMLNRVRTDVASVMDVRWCPGFFFFRCESTNPAGEKNQ